MKFYYITFRSVTFAQRAERVLNTAGIHCTLLRTPKWMEAQGCSYSLRIWAAEITPAIEMLRKNQVSWRKIYAQKSDGILEELGL